MVRRKSFQSVFCSDFLFDVSKEIVTTFKEKEWGDQPQILALAQVLRRDIVVINAHIDSLAGKCAVASCAQRHRRIFLYEAENRRDHRRHILLFTSCLRPGAPGGINNHYIPLIRKEGKYPPHFEANEVLSLQEKANKK